MNAKQATDKALEDRVRRAVDYFMKGYGCCQSVVAAFADLYGMDRETALKVGAGFGGGVGRMRMMCGAVSGLVILAGLDAGQTSDKDSSHTRSDSGSDATLIRNTKAGCYRLVQDLLEKFRQDNGSIICAELLGLTPESAAGTHGRSPDTVVGTHGQMHGLKSGPGDFVPSERNAEYYRTRPCAAKVESAARIFAEYLQSKSQA